MASRSAPKKTTKSAAKKSAPTKSATAAKKVTPGTKARGASRPAAKKTTAKKSAPVKSAAATKKTASSGTGSKKPSARDRLAAELSGMIPEIDAEGLLFLIRQANVLLHNKRVDELNAEMEKLNESKMEAHKKAGTTARVGQNVQEITVEIQRSPDGKTYYMIIDNRKHFLTASEMAAVVKLSVKPERKSDALRYMYEYMRNERDEILMDHGINSGKHPFFEALFYEIRRKFSLNK